MTVFYDEFVWIVEVGINSVSAIFMILILVSYRTCLRNRLSFAFQILMVLFINELGACLSRLLHFCAMDNTALCSLSLILSTGFDVAANIWTCFISYVVVKECNQPGRYIAFWKVVARNIVLTYVPSVCICVLIGVLLELDNQKTSATVCWRALNDPNLYDYIIYAAAFILPSFIAALVNIINMYRYSKLEHSTFNKFLLFPALQVVSAAYYIAIKVYLMFAGDTAFEYSEVVYLSQPMLYGLLFLVLVVSWLSKDSSDTTSILSDRLRGNSIEYY